MLHIQLYCKPDDTLLSGCGKDEREGKNNALAGSKATFQSRQLAYSELCTMAFIFSD